jgi:hypothetical protein
VKVNASYPDESWDGLSLNTDRLSLFSNHSPNYQDWDQIVAEMMAVEEGNQVKYMGGDSTIASATPGALSDLLFDVDAGSKYVFDGTLFLANSVAGEGADINFNGGDCTITAMRAHAVMSDAALKKSLQVTALGTAIGSATVTGDSIVEFSGYVDISAAGTFGPAAGEHSHSSGTLTVYKGSHMSLRKIG